MSPSAPQPASPSRLRRLLGFLAQDPDNRQLIEDAAGAALDEGEFDQAKHLVDRCQSLGPQSASLLNLKGLIALNEQQFDEAASAFQALWTLHPDDAALAFNLAWSKAMLQDYGGALALLDEATMAAAPRAAALKIQMMHHLGLLDEALVAGAGLAERFPKDQDLMGALALVAIDAEETDLAKTYALRATDRHEGLSTLGMLDLADQRVDQSILLFDKALLAYPGSARALLGKGLGLLAKGDPNAAAGFIDKGAEAFGDHLGSWVAAGWAYFVQGDYGVSRARFEHALEIDDSFAETHGGLAVLDIVEGHMEPAKRRTDIALRLDPKCFAGALAKSLILASGGDAEKAERIRAIALNSPIGPNGRTIAQTMVSMGMAGPGPLKS